MNSFADRFVLPTPIHNRSPKMDGKVYSELVEDNNKNGPLLEEKALADAHVRTAKQFAEYLDAKAGTADSAGGGGEGGGFSACCRCLYSPLVSIVVPCFLVTLQDRS